MFFTIAYIPPPYHDEVVELEADTAEEAIERFYADHDGLSVVVAVEPSERNSKSKNHSKARSQGDGVRQKPQP